MNFTKLLYLLIGVIVLLFLPMQLIAADITWTPVQTNYSVYVHFPTGSLLSWDTSTTLGDDASDFFTYSSGTIPPTILADGTGVTGDNNARDLFSETAIYSSGEWGGSADIVTYARQVWTFSVDHATPIEVSYSLDGSMSLSGSYSTLSDPVYAKFSIYKYMYTPTFLDIVEFSPSAGIISENGSFVIDYDNEPGWTYGIEMDLKTYAGFLVSNSETMVNSNIDSFQVNLSVVPEPVSSTLFIIGGVTLGFRRFRNKITNQ